MDVEKAKVNELAKLLRIEDHEKDATGHYGGIRGKDVKQSNDIPRSPSFRIEIAR